MCISVAFDVFVLAFVGFECVATLTTPLPFDPRQLCSHLVPLPETRRYARYAFEETPLSLICMTFAVRWIFVLVPSLFHVYSAMSRLYCCNMFCMLLCEQENANTHQTGFNLQL